MPTTTVHSEADIPEEVIASMMDDLTRAERSSWPCRAGIYKKDDFWMVPDFDSPLDEFKEYME